MAFFKAKVPVIEGLCRHITLFEQICECVGNGIFNFSCAKLIEIFRCPRLTLLYWQRFKRCQIAVQFGEIFLNMAKPKIFLSTKHIPTEEQLVLEIIGWGTIAFGLCKTIVILGDCNDLLFYPILMLRRRKCSELTTQIIHQFLARAKISFAFGWSGIEYAFCHTHKQRVANLEIIGFF